MASSGLPDAGASATAHPRRRQQQAEGRAAAELAADVELAAVALHHVLDDGQPEAGAAGVARAAAVDFGASDMPLKDEELAKRSAPGRWRPRRSRPARRLR
jgi:hypothetical protein